MGAFALLLLAGVPALAIPAGPGAAAPEPSSPGQIAPPPMTADGPADRSISGNFTDADLADFALGNTTGTTDILSVTGNVTLLGDTTSCTKDEKNPFVTGKNSSWEATGPASATVIRDGGMFKMWYHADNGTKNHIGMATSPNGINWTKSGKDPVFSPAGSGDWDSVDVMTPSVLKDGATYHMWYTGRGSVGGAKIGHATSPDGLSWTRTPNTPVLNLGGFPVWDSLSLGPMSVIKDGATFKMWYSGRALGAGYSIGYATSADGVAWNKAVGSNPVLLPTANTWDSAEVLTPRVIKDGATYHMWYAGHTTGTSLRLGHAESSDGTGWTKVPGAPVLLPGKFGTWDDTAVPSGWVLKEGPYYRMWYTGYDETDIQNAIGHARGNYSSPGTFRSRVFDTGSDGSLWDRLWYNATTIDGTDIQLSTRSMGVGTPNGTWSAWTASTNLSGAAVLSPRARYIQYRAVLSTTRPLLSPFLDDVTIGYRTDELPVALPTGPSPTAWQATPAPTVTWQYTDTDLDAQAGYHVEVSSDPSFSVIAASTNATGAAATWRVSPGLLDGTWSWRVRARDPYLWGAWSAASSFRIDATPPANPGVASTSHTLGVWSVLPAVSVAVTPIVDIGSGLSGYSVSWDNLPSTVPPSFFTHDDTVLALESGNLSDGTWYVHVRAFDLAGNWNVSARHLGPFLIDATAPMNPTNLTSPSHDVGRWSNRSAVELAWSPGSDAGSGLARYTFLWDTTSDTVPDGSPTIDANATTVAGPDLDDGSGYFFHIRSEDRVGSLASGATHLGPFQIDTTPPKVATFDIDGGNTTTTERTVDLSFSATDLSGVAGISISVDGGGWSNVIGLDPAAGPDYTVPYTLPGTEGDHIVAARIRDRAGNVAPPVDSLIAYRPPPPNTPPRVQSITDQNATAGEPWKYQIVGQDADRDPLRYVLANAPAGMTVNATTGEMSWNATAAQAGIRYLLTVLVDDGIHPAVPTTMNITARAAPTIVLSYPQWNTKVRGVVRIQGEARAPGSTITSVVITVGNDAPETVPLDTTEGWIYKWDSRKAKNGPLHIEVEGTAANGLRGSDEVSVVVDNPTTIGGPQGLLFPLLLAALLAGILAAAVISRRRRREGPETAPGGERDEGPPADAPAASAVVAVRGGKGAGAGAAAPPVPAMALAGAADNEGTGDGFTVEDAYLVYRDGRLIHHEGPKAVAGGPDQEVVAGMLAAIQSFIKDSLDRGGDEELGAIEFGERRIIVERSPHLFLGLVVRGTPPSDVRERMRDTVERIQGMHAGVIENWDGDSATVSRAKEILAPMFLALRRASAAGGKRRIGVSVKSGLEFYQGYVRLKVGIRNEGSTTLTDTSFKLTFDRKTLRLTRVEPDYEREGTEVLVGHLEPGQKRSIAFYLDPVICTETPVDGMLLYKDYEGNLHTDQMKRRMVDIVCPIFYTEETVNAAMLKRLVTDMKYRDGRVYRWPERLTVLPAEAAARASIQAHAVRFIRRFEAGEDIAGSAEGAAAPPIQDRRVIELWFYGKVQTTGEEMVIRSTLREAGRTLEVFVASDNLITLTGLLAELGHNLTDEIKRIDRTAVLARAPEREEEEAMARRSLLERAAESDLAAQDN